MPPAPLHVLLRRRVALAVRHLHHHPSRVQLVHPRTLNPSHRPARVSAQRRPPSSCARRRRAGCARAQHRSTRAGGVHESVSDQIYFCEPGVQRALRRLAGAPSARPLEQQLTSTRPQAAGTALVASLVQHLHPSIPLASKSNLTASASAEPPIIISIPTITPWWTTTGGRLGADLSIIHTLNPGALRPSHNFTHLAYAAAWAAATSLLTTKLAPFVAVHWRTERVPSRFFPACTKSLISTLSQLQREYPTISNVYLLTDYPLESLRGHEGEVEPHSASYGYVPRQVSKSMRVLVDWIEREGSKLALTTWTQEENVLPFANVTRELLPVGTRLKDRKSVV